MKAWLKKLQRRAAAADHETPITISHAELSELVAHCRVKSRRLHLLAEMQASDQPIEIKPRTALELVRACRWEKAVSLKVDRSLRDRKAVESRSDSSTVEGTP